MISLDVLYKSRLKQLFSGAYCTSIITGEPDWTRSPKALFMIVFYFKGANKKPSKQQN